MKKIGFLKLGLTYAGCFLGAGYVSGRELWQFFGIFGKNAYPGFLIAMLLLMLTGVLMLEINRLGHITEVDKLIVPWKAPLAQGAVIVLELCFLFGVTVIMSAGAGALLEQLFAIPAYISSLLFVAIICYCSLAGLGGMVNAFSATVPVLAAVTVIFGIVSLVQNGIVIPEATADASNPLTGLWLPAALSFACYNLFGNIAIVAPLGEYMKSKRASVFGVILGVLLLSAIALSVLSSLGVRPDYAELPLPMLAYAEELGRPLGYLYGFLLLLAMFGTALSSLVGFSKILGEKSKLYSRKKTPLTIACGLAIFLGSLFGFGNLISVIYPIFGYCSSVFIVMLILHYIKLKRGEKNVKA